MFKKVLGKAAAGTAAASLLFVPGAVTAAPQIATVACEYPDRVATNTQVSLDNMAAPYGSPNTAHVEVSSAAAAPEGQVRVRVETGGTWVQQLSGGSATRALPRTLDAGRTYTVRADFIRSCDYAYSFDTIDYIVVKADVNVNPAVVNGRRAQFDAAFLGSGGLDPSVGQARFTVQKNGKTIRSQAVGVRRGLASVNLPDLANGKYKLTVSYNGTSNFKVGQDTRWFTVS
jgi:hypothetical protein